MFGIQTGVSYFKQNSLIRVRIVVFHVELFDGVRLGANMLTVYGYGSTGVSGTDPGSSIPATSAPYGNSTSSYYFPSGTAPYSTGTDPGTTTSYGTVSGAPYPTSNSSDPTYPSGTLGTTGDPSATKTIASTGDPSGTAASTGLDPSGKPTYTAPTGIPAEYYYHHKKPKRNVRRSSSFQQPQAMNSVLTRVAQSPYGRSFFGYRA